jgi:transglutaminase/protease-like cytokinesis protein 3
VQIRKLTNDNKKKTIMALKKTDEIKRIKKVNDALKKLLKPLKHNSFKSSMTSSPRSNIA